ncbi:MAG TPA: heavy metal translocating P-type ATPase [Woeseiaceae bacterium]|nr:heavy metal translocating P-type ATPase [Woeseiaceae bacterium]
MAGDQPCFHCGEPVADAAIIARVGDVDEPVCCIGCKAVAEFIHASRLGAFYRFRKPPDSALELRPGTASFSHYDQQDLQSRFVHRNGNDAEATIEIGGIYCSACVWLLENALKKLDGVLSLEVNPVTRRAVIRWDASLLRLSELLSAIARVGFRPQPLAVGHAADLQDIEYRKALKRLIVAAAAGMQVMMFAVAMYAGDFFGIESDIEQFLRSISLLVTLPVIFYSARPFYTAAWRGVRAGSPGMDLPVAIAISIAFFASVNATWLNEGPVYFDSVAMFVLFLSTTRFLEMRARHRSDDYALALTRLLPDTATLIRKGEQEIVALDRIRSGDIIRVRSGDVLPVDGEVLSGTLSIDESFLSGESVPVIRSCGMTVLAGSVNRGGSAEVRVTRTGAATNLAEISRLLERARADRPPIAQLADRIARHVVVGLLGLATVAGTLWLALEPARALEIVLATLVVTCPCALALATPAALAAAASTLAGRGFLLVRSRLLEVLAKPAVFVFDKIGTLTAGRPEILQTQVLSSQYSEAQCLAIAAALETASEHVLARAFAAHKGRDMPLPENVAVESGCGVEGTIGAERWRIGSAPWLQAYAESAVPKDHDPDSHTIVWLGNKKQLVARFDIGDELRTDALDAVTALKSAGFRLMIASGDREAAVRRIAGKLGITDWRAGLRPEQKVALVHALRDAGETVVMVGDGVNDAPVLAAADASIALDAGTALARASADAIVLGKRMQGIVDAVDIARATRRIIRQNMAWAIGYNLAAVPLAVSGLLAPWMAALGMSLSSLLVVSNALRLRRPMTTMPVASPAKQPSLRSLPADA